MLTAKMLERLLYTLAGQVPRFEGRCCLVSPEPIGIRPEDAANRIGLLPLDLLLLAASRQAEAALGQRLIS